MRLLDFTRIVPSGILVALALLSLGPLAASVSANPTSSTLSQLPTRPAASNPPSQPSTPAPPDPKPPSQPPASAQPPVPTSTPTQVTAPDELSPEVPLAQRLVLTFEQLGYGTTHLNREDNARWHRMYLPGNFQVLPEGNYLDLVTYHLPEIPDRLAVLKVELNQHLLYTVPLTGSNAVSNTVRVNLPDGGLQPGANFIRIALDTSATCEDPGAIVDAFVDLSSVISFGYQQNPYPTDLSRYPFPFVEQSLLDIPVTLVLPDDPTSDDLAMAATVAAGLGQMSGGSIDLTAVVGSELVPSVRGDSHLIVIGRPQSNGLLNDLQLPLPIDDTTLEAGQGVLEEIVSPWNPFRLVLVVSGLDDEAVFRASNALNRETHFLGMRGPIAVIDQLRPLSPKLAAPRTPSMTLASLGYEDQVMYGARVQGHAFEFTLPLGWQLEALPFFVLKFSHADIIDPDASAMDVALNGVPVGSTLLDADNADAGELTLSLPKHLLKSGQNRLQVGVEMNFLPESRDKCIDLDDERAWTVVSSESEIFLPYSAIDLPLDLGLFPYPFSHFGLYQTLFVLPDLPSSEIASDMIRLAVLLGSPSHTDYILPQVAYASEVGEQVRENHHLILLGRPTENAVLRAANAYLPQPFVPDSDILEPLVVDSVAFVPDSERHAGLLQLIVSPWAEEYSLLAVTGTTDDGIRLAVQTLLELPKSLEGNLAVVEPALLPEEPNQVSTYAIDTRSPATISEDESKSNAIFDGNLVLLAERWWK